MQNFYLDPAPPEDLMTAVGRISNLWQMIEARIEATIWGLAELSADQGRSITSHMTFPLRCDVLRALYHTHFRDSKADKELSRLIEKRIKPASTIRHRYAHAMWLKDDSGNSILLEKDSRGKPDVSPRTITVKDLGAEALTIFAAYFQISTYLSGSTNYDAVIDRLFEENETEFGELEFQDDLIPVEPYLRPTVPGKPQFLSQTAET